MINYAQLQARWTATGNRSIDDRLIFEFKIIFGSGRVQTEREFSVILRCTHSEFPGFFGHPLAD